MAQARLSDARVSTYAARNTKDEAQLAVTKSNTYKLFGQAMYDAGYGEKTTDNPYAKEFNNVGKSLETVVSEIINNYGGEVQRFLAEANEAE